jgi:hypothetical protein
LPKYGIIFSRGNEGCLCKDFFSYLLMEMHTLILTSFL